jgi:hypothetical protein
MLPKKKGFHRHHVIPKHQGGTDDDSNIVYLTPEEHAKAHLALYEQYGHYEDAQAYNSLKKHWLGARSLDGYKQSPEHIAKRVANTDYNKISEKLKGRRSPTTGMKLGPPSALTRQKISDANRGRKQSERCKKKISDSLKGRESPKKIECYCIFCRKHVSPSKLDRHGAGKAACNNNEDRT